MQNRYVALKPPEVRNGLEKTGLRIRENLKSASGHRWDLYNLGESFV